MNMKKNTIVGILALAAVALAPAARAARTGAWYGVDIYSTAYTKDTTPSASTCADYSAYYCTVAAAKEMFNNKSDVAGITEYLKANFATGKEAMGDGSHDSWAVNDAAYYEAGQYTFENTLTGALVGSEYLAVLFYKDEAFRVFGTANAAVAYGHAIFDDLADSASGGNVGAWQQAIPEPASGLLALLGAGLVALRRRRRAKKA